MKIITRIVLFIGTATIVMFAFNNFWIDRSYKSDCFLNHSKDWANAICYDKRDPNDFSTYEVDKEKPPKVSYNWAPSIQYECGSYMYEDAKKFDPFTTCTKSDGVSGYKLDETK